MDTKFMIVAKRQLDLSVAKIETERKKYLSPAARIMLEAILLESLTVRENEWKSRSTIKFEAAGSENQLGEILTKSFDAVLHQAYIDQSGDWITTKDLLTAIQKKWCGIFPIC